MDGQREGSALIVGESRSRCRASCLGMRMCEP